MNSSHMYQHGWNSGNLILIPKSYGRICFYKFEQRAKLYNIWMQSCCQTMRKSKAWKMTVVVSGRGRRCDWGGLHGGFCHSEMILKNKFMHLFLAVLGLCCCSGFSLVVVSGGYSSLQCAGFSLWWLLVAEHRLYGMRASVVSARRLSSCSCRALEQSQ